MVNPSPLSFKAQMQDKWKITFYIILFFILIFCSYFLFSDENISRGIFIGGVCGIFSHYKVTRISELLLPKKKVNYKEIESYLYDFKYVKNDQSKAFIPQIPRSFRFDAQNVYIADKKENYSVFGPMYILKKLSKNLGK